MAKKTAKSPPKKKKKKPSAPKKYDLWFKFYTDPTNKETFLDMTASAKAAKYNAKNDRRFSEIGYQNSILLQEEIRDWFDSIGLTDNVLDTELLQQLRSAEKTEFIKVKGHTDLTELHPDAFEVVKTHKMAWEGKDEDAKAFDDGETVLGINVENKDLRRRLLDMAYKRKGLYVKKHEHEVSGKGDRPIVFKIVSNIPEPAPPPDENGNSDSKKT